MNELIIEKAASSLNENHSDSTSKTFSKTPYKNIGIEKSEFCINSYDIIILYSAPCRWGSVHNSQLTKWTGIWDRWPTILICPGWSLFFQHWKSQNPSVLGKPGQLATLNVNLAISPLTWPWVSYLQPVSIFFSGQIGRIIIIPPHYVLVKIRGGDLNGLTWSRSLGSPWEMITLCKALWNQSVSQHSPEEVKAAHS